MGVRCYHPLSTLENDLIPTMVQHNPSSYVRAGGVPTLLCPWCYTDQPETFAANRPSILQHMNSLFPKDLPLQSYKEKCLPYPLLQLTPQVDTLTHTKFTNIHNMCPIKNLLTKRSTRNLRDPALSPYPPNIFPFKPESEAEIRHESISDFIEPQRKSKRESEKSLKSKRDSKIVLPPRLHPPPLPLSSHFSTFCPIN